MKEFLVDFAEAYAEKFDYKAEITEDVALIKTQYGELGFRQAGEDVTLLKVKPLDEENEDQRTSLVKIKKHFTGALQKAIVKHQEENTEPTGEPGTPEPSSEAAPEELDNLGRPYPKTSDKPPAHFTKPEKVKGGKKMVDDKIAAPPAPEPQLAPEDIPGTKAYGDKQRATRDPVNKLGNSAEAMEKAAKAEIGGKKPSFDDVMNGNVTPEAKAAASQPATPKTVPAQPVPATPPVRSGELVMESAKREMAFIKILVSSPAGGGKTLGALLLAYGLCGNWSKVCIIDTENRSGSLYVGTEVEGTKIGKYNTIVIQSPYTVDRYLKAMEMAEKSGMEVIIYDSLSHAWTAEGGLLDLHTKITAASKSGNSYTAWKDVTPLHAKLIEKIMSCSMHVIMCARSKTEYVLEKTDRGSAPKKVGMGIVFRDGLEYDCSIAFEIDQASHVAAVTKDRTRVFADSPYMKLGIADGQKIKAWLNSSEV